jgi:hypothetical protein
MAGPNTNEASEQAHLDNASDGGRKAENIRYGEAISEHGFGGKTGENTGVANQGTGRDGGRDGEGQTRMAQGYGGGSGIGGG